MRRSWKAKVKGKPTATGETIKGKGISFMEDGASWYGKALNDEEYSRAMDDLLTRRLTRCWKRRKNSREAVRAAAAGKGGERKWKNKKITIRESYGNALAELGKHMRIWCLDADLAEATKTPFSGVFPNVISIVDCRSVI